MSDTKLLRWAEEKGRFLICHLLKSKIKVKVSQQWLPTEMWLSGQSVKMVNALNLHLSHPTLQAGPIQSLLFALLSTCAQSHCLNPGVKGLKVFAAIKRARLIPESIFRNTHTRYAHVHAWRTNNHYFWSPVLILLFTIEWFVAVWLKMEHWTSACMTQRLPLLCAGQCDASTSPIQGNLSLIVTFACRPLVLTCCFYSTKPNYEIVADCKMHFSGVFPQCCTLPPSLNPANRDEVPASQTVRQLCPPMCHQLGWTWLTVHPRTNPGGFLVQRSTPYMHKLSFVLVQMGRSTHLVLPHPSPSNHGLYTECCFRKALFLIGISTETAEKERELMKGTGRIFCPCVFCLVPAEKRDTLCSANELSTAITVYTAASEPYPCAFWHCAPQCLTGSMDVWPGHQGSTTVIQTDQRMIVAATWNIRMLEKVKIYQMLNGAPVTLYA